jgi:hypothetical protein
MDVDDKGRAWGEYLRVRVLINVNEPLMRYMSVFSQSRQETDHYAVMYERMPTFCFSCGLIGHSSLSCPTPAERDEYCFLPYHGPKLCVLDERKKETIGDELRTTLLQWTGVLVWSWPYGPILSGAWSV